MCICIDMCIDIYIHIYIHICTCVFIRQYFYVCIHMHSSTYKVIFSDSNTQ